MLAYSPHKHEIKIRERTNVPHNDTMYVSFFLSESQSQNNQPISPIHAKSSGNGKHLPSTDCQKKKHLPSTATNETTRLEPV
jgi:hypothetical protein